jgi:threonine aldolase
VANFASDNVTGAAPAVIEALARANEGPMPPYGADPITARVEVRLSEVFERDCKVFPVATGTAANVLALSVVTPPYGAIYCHALSHINVDECAAPEFYSGGAKLVLLEGEGAKFSAAALAAAITGGGDVHHVQPAAVSISQSSELGAVYRPEEIAAIAEVARAHGLPLHMDGARFANGLVALGRSPAEATWLAGVDILSFGASKNGALAAEAVVFFNPEQAGDFIYRRKRGGHLFSKMRFLSAQLEAYLEDDLWLKNAGHANAMARRLAEGLAALPGARLTHEVEANALFPHLPKALIAGLLAEGFQFYPWGDEDAGQIRLVTAFNTREEDVAAFLACAQRHASGG